MKRIILTTLAAMSCAFFIGCHQNSPSACHISGTVKGEQYEGKRIFLVPLTGPATSQTVDSMEISNGEFSFSPDTMQMYKILLDYHYRIGVQPLLVVAEPGNITVTIDSVSHAGGTPQNDSLEQWKIRTEMHNYQLARMSRKIDQLQKQGDKVQAEYLKQRADSFHKVHKTYTRQLAKNLKEGPLHDFLDGLYPLTYRKKMPDGRIVIMNADTNEEVAQ